MKFFFASLILLSVFSNSVYAQADKPFEASNFQKELMNLLENTKQPDCHDAAKGFETS